MGKAEAYEQVMSVCQQTVTYVNQPGKYNVQPKHCHRRIMVKKISSNVQHSSSVVGRIVLTYKLEAPGSNPAIDCVSDDFNFFFVTKFAPIYTYLTFAASRWLQPPRKLID